MEKPFLHTAIEQVQSMMDRHAAAMVETMSQDAEIKVLDAGCGDGTWTWFHWPRRAYLTGIDVSARQIETNRVAQEKLVGDLQRYQLAASAYDIIVCCNLLEHLEHPELALENLTTALRPGGMIVIAAPMRESFKGLVARATPHSFHVFYYRRLMGNPNAGKPDMFPFPTHLKREMSKDSIASFARQHGLSVDFSATWMHPAVEELKHTKAPLHYLIQAGGAVAKLLSFGAIRPEVTEFIMVLGKSQQIAGRDGKTFGLRPPVVERSESFRELTRS